MKTINKDLCIIKSKGTYRKNLKVPLGNKKIIYFNQTFHKSLPLGNKKMIYFDQTFHKSLPLEN